MRRCGDGLSCGWWWRQGVALVGVIVVGASSAVPVQAKTYTVFPAKAAGSIAAMQPTGHGITAHVTLVIRDSTIKYAVNELARQAHLQPVINETQVLGKRISVRLVDVNVMDAFAIVLHGTGLVARLATDGETVVIRQANSVTTDRARIQGGLIAGHVADSTTGRGLKGVSVRVAGAKLTTVTSDNGEFSLRNVSPGDQLLQVRLFGYRPAERRVTVVEGEQTTVRIVLMPVPTVLSGVVTTATGLQRKVEVGNDITTINVDSVMRVAPVSTVTDLLETRVPGLTVQHTSGVPGNPSRIRMRGVSSINGNNDPILVVDGIRVYASQSDPRNDNLAHALLGDGGLSGYAAPSPVDQIDPSSIETIEIFKGPSASALYGSDAANGVIVITTKHGRAGPTHWNLALGQGVSWLPGQWPVNYYRFGQDPLGLSTAPNGICAWNDPYCVVDSLVSFQALNDPRYSIFSHGRDQTASLTISGGVSTLQYSLTGSGAGNLGYLKLPAIEAQRYAQFYGTVPGWMLRPDNYQTWGGNGQLTAQPTSMMRATLTSTLFNSEQQQGALQRAIAQLESEYVSAMQLQQTNSPLIMNDIERATDHQLSAMNALTLTWQPYSWLPLSVTGGLNVIERTDQTYIPYGVSTCGTIYQCGHTTGAYGLGRGVSQDQTISIGTNIPALHSRMALAIGANYHSGSITDVNAFTNQLAPGVSSPTSFPTTGCTGGAGGCSSFGQATAATSTYGWYVEPRFNVHSRFFVSPGFRLDGGSASGVHGGFHGSGLTGLPKIDFSYLVVDGSHTRGLLTLLRPRVAFGVAGSQPGPTDKLRLLFDTVGVLNSGLSVPLIGVATLGNTQLRPETSRELEGGGDAELWGGRLTTTWTGYNKTRYNAIMAVPYAPSVNGGGLINRNIGVVRNTGRELTVTAQVFQSRAFGWMVGGNLSSDHNLVVRLNPGQAPLNLSGGAYDGVQTRIVAGYPLFGRWALPIVSFADLNHNGIIEPNEIVYGDSLIFLGSETPNYQMNLTTGVTLLSGRLSVNATFAYQDGLTQFNIPNGGTDGGSFVLLPNRPGTSLATQAAVVAATGGFQGIGGIPSVIGLVQTVNTFRFNDLSINYVVPPAVATWLHVPHVTLALQGSNLGLHTNYRGKDPSVNAFSTVSAGDQTIDTGQFPQPRVWWLKLTLGN